MKFQTEGLIIKEMNIGEKDKLLSALTRERGVIKAFARGAKGVNSAKRSATTLLTYSRLTLYEGKSDAYSVGDALALRVFSSIREDIKKTMLAQYFCELALTVCPAEQSAGAFLSLVLNSLYLLDKGLRSPELIKPCCEMRLASLAGYMPDLRICEGCGAYLKEKMYFLPQSGTLICSDCYGGGSKDAVELSAAALTALRHTVYADDDKLFSFALSDEGLKQLNSASEAYLRYHFEKEFKTLSYYKNI